MRADLLALIGALVRDESSRLSAGNLETALDLAVARYGQDRPRSLVEDVVAVGDTLPLPATWESESTLLHAEYPLGSWPPATLPCSLYTAPTGAVLRLGGILPVSSVVRLTFSVRHEVSDTANTVLPAHQEAVAAYAAAWLLEQLSAAAINEGESTIAADVTDRRSKSQEYARRAEKLKARYGEALGLSMASAGPVGGGPSAAGTTTSWPARRRLIGH